MPLLPQTDFSGSADGGGRAGLLIEQGDEISDFAQFIRTFFGDRVRNLSNLEHPTAANVPKTAKQQFTLTIIQFQMNQVAHGIVVQQTSEGCYSRDVRSGHRCGGMLIAQSLLHKYLRSLAVVRFYATI